MRILLFDIDGTLIRSGGAGKAAMEMALVSEFGVQEIVDRVSYSGRTDVAISIDLLQIHNVESNTANVRRLHDAYLRHLPECLRKNRGIVLPGISELLSSLHSRTGIALGLLTGNIRAGGECKLRHYELWNYFAFGGFADGIHDRDDVARQAFRESSRHLQRDVDPRNVWVIGDTPYDVQCARAIGANAVAVATGWHDIEELRSCRPDHLLRDLSDPATLLREWGLKTSLT
jgi:phosphoglycolate phosphatase-like HAD superfamily hydrolase